MRTGTDCVQHSSGPRAVAARVAAARSWPRRPRVRRAAAQGQGVVPDRQRARRRRGIRPGDVQLQPASDVVTVVNDVADRLQRPRPRALALAMKDPGGGQSPTTPTSANFITLTQLPRRFIRADGRNVQGVDVPYAFDGGMTLTVRDSESRLVHARPQHRQGRSAARAPWRSTA